VAYRDEVTSLNSKLQIALRNAPLERQAQVLANAVVEAKRAANPNMDSDDLKKIRNQALAESRIRTGAKKQRIEITPEEWTAVQAGAISNHMLTKILNNADLERVRELATPRPPRVMSSTKTTRAKSMLASGFTQAQVARAMGVSLSTLKSAIEG
jgi:DNA-binding TFAR19-related protein (PDSD5 family)